MDFNSLHELLRTTYNEMIPLSSQLTGVAKGIAGLGALFYIACYDLLHWDCASCFSRRWFWEVSMPY